MDHRGERRRVFGGAAFKVFRSWCNPALQRISCGVLGYDSGPPGPRSVGNPERVTLGLTRKMGDRHPASSRPFSRTAPTNWPGASPHLPPLDSNQSLGALVSLVEDEP